MQNAGRSILGELRVIKSSYTPLSQPAVVYGLGASGGMLYTA
jgi:hypothetical protein